MAKKRPTQATPPQNAVEGAQTALQAAQGYLTRLNAARKAAGEEQPTSAYFTSFRELCEALPRWFSDTTADGWASLLPDIEFQAGTAIPWDKAGAFRYAHEHTGYRLTVEGEEGKRRYESTFPEDGKIEAPESPQTWRKRLGIRKGAARWKDICISVSEKGLHIQHNSGSAMLETWEGLGFPNPCNPRTLLEWLQGESVLRIKGSFGNPKNEVYKLRGALKKASGIQENPLLFNAGEVSRLFRMGNENSTHLPEAECLDYTEGGFNIRTR